MEDKAKAFGSCINWVTTQNRCCVPASGDHGRAQRGRDHDGLLASSFYGTVMAIAVLSSGKLGEILPFSQDLERRCPLSPALHHPGRVEGRQKSSGTAGPHWPERLQDRQVMFLQLETWEVTLEIKQAMQQHTTKNRGGLSTFLEVQFMSKSPVSLMWQLLQQQSNPSNIALSLMWHASYEHSSLWNNMAVSPKQNPLWCDILHNTRAIPQTLHSLCVTVSVITWLSLWCDCLCNNMAVSLTT